ncbi:unnamed protein product [Parascedosporium putredinis]|uniref:Uncharacterized protein n=1 Tax=Parascedosporium putredinis TaxID=1442378 RepID=A0A9P1GYX2_9PEZI|nr:unnamed protein product [Parascedosporium putredinis]CAI7990349.1 unnamed protein product [Parascedosporium putredinis]
MSRPTRNYLRCQHDSSDEIEIMAAKHRHTADDQEVEEQSLEGKVQKEQLQRYWTRPLAVIFIPAIITAYYGVIWYYLLQENRSDKAAKYRTFSGSVIFYSWFIVGVFGLSWSKFGLLGLETSMLNSRRWAAPNLVSVLWHSDNTWNSPSGWYRGL